jgi:hypothetical protein
MDSRRPSLGDPRRLDAELRDDRAGRRDPGAVLIPVEGGEPMPAEEPPTPAPGAGPKTF